MLWRKTIPNLFTAGNLLSGCFAILLASNEWHRPAVLCVIVGMLLDTMDGRIARYLKGESEFGKELDSLADLVTFGVAPSLILFRFGMEGFPSVPAALIVSLFPVFGALRLARFNLNHAKNHRYFVGLPITAAGFILSVSTLMNEQIAPPVYLLILVLLSTLMISTLKHPNFKKIPFPKHTLVALPFFLLLALLLNTHTSFTLPLTLAALSGSYGVILFVQLQARKMKRQKDEEKNA